MVNKNNKRVMITLNCKDIERLESLCKSSQLSLSQQIKELIIDAFYKKGVK